MMITLLIKEGGQHKRQECLHTKSCHFTYTDRSKNGLISCELVCAKLHILCYCTKCFDNNSFFFVIK